MDMHERIGLARKAAGFNKSELARTLGLTPTSCSSWELAPSNRNNSRPSVENLARLALILNVRFEWLATGRGPMPLISNSDSQAIADGKMDKATTLLTLYRSLPAAQRATLLEFISLVSNQPATRAKRGAGRRAGQRRKPAQEMPSG